jgi:hypothetical protein
MLSRSGDHPANALDDTRAPCSSQNQLQDAASFNEVCLPHGYNGFFPASSYRAATTAAAYSQPSVSKRTSIACFHPVNPWPINPTGNPHEAFSDLAALDFWVS